eukprot:4790239-Alexandrium_andersonii.AAC.1
MTPTPSSTPLSALRRSTPVGRNSQTRIAQLPSLASEAPERRFAEPLSPDCGTLVPGLRNLRARIAELP